MYIMDREDIKMLVNKWWDVFNDESLNLNRKALQMWKKLLQNRPS